MMKQFYLCGFSVSTKNGMVSLDHNMAGVSSASSSHIVIRGTAAKIQLPVHKILLLGAAPTLKCCSQMDLKGTHNNGKDSRQAERTHGLIQMLLVLLNVGFT